MRKIILFCIGVFILSNTLAQNTNELLVRVLNIDYQPISGASVFIKETNQTVVTNTKGEINIALGAKMIYTLVVSYNGKKFEETLKYDTQKQYVVYVNENPIALKEVSISGGKKFAEKKSDYVARMPLENLQNSQTYNIIPQELLKNQGITDFNAALMSAPGLANITSGVGSGGFRFEARMRGFATSSSTLKNGLYLNTYSVADLSNIESIEVIKGPSSTLFGGVGTISYGGLINIATKKPKPYQFGEVSYAFGGYNLNRFTVDFNTPLNASKTVLFRLNAALHYADSFQDYGKTKRQFIAPSFRFLVNDKLTLDLDIEYGKTSQNITAIGVPANVAKFSDFNWNIKKSYTIDGLASTNEIFNVIANAKYVIDENWTSNTIVSNAKADNLGNYLFLVPTSATNVGRRIMRIPNTFTSMTVQQNFVGIHQGNGFSNKVLVGFDFNHAKNINSRTMANFYDTIDRNAVAPMINLDGLDNLLATQVPSEYDMNNKTFSGYVSDVFSLNDRLHLNAGIRFEHYQDIRKSFTEKNFSPKAGLVFELLPKQISLYGNYMNAFKNGYRQDPSPLFNEFVAKPEKAKQYEFGAKYELLDKKLHGNLSYYNITVEDIMRQTVDGNGKLGITQDGTLRSRGFDFDLTANPIEGFNVILGYGYNESKFIKGDATKINKRPEGTPYHVANFWTSYRIGEGLLNGFGLGVGGNYSGDFFGNDANTIKMSSYFILDASVFYDKNQFRLGVKANNLANKEYYTTNFWIYPQATRTITGTLTYQF